MLAARCCSGLLFLPRRGGFHGYTVVILSSTSSRPSMVLVAVNSPRLPGRVGRYRCCSPPSGRCRSGRRPL
ncbi:hypothetical protein ACWC09_10640 [Streptomyces sp. NPDC001617]